MKPGADALVERAARILPPHASVLDVGGAPVPSPKLASHRVTVAPEREALALLRAHTAAPFDAMLVAWPSRIGPLMPLLQAMHGALAADGRALVCELVWQTAPTVELLAAFAPAPGGEKVRPIEGFEMQVEHTGFAIESRDALPPATWADLLPPGQRAAVEGDTRGAAKLGVWVLRPSDD